MHDFLHIASHILEHSIIDTAYLVPFLFLTYIFMEWIEHCTSQKLQNSIKSSGKAGPIVGAILGVVPQCGFSAVASTLYAGRVITIGTLFAVFVSTSDEMLPIFIAGGVSLSTICCVLGTKIAIGIILGFIIDAVYNRFFKHDEAFKIHDICMRDACDCCHDCATSIHNPETVYGHFDDCNEYGSSTCHHGHTHVHEHTHDRKHRIISILKSALTHTIKITIFVFAVTLVLTALIEIYGEDNIAKLISNNEALAIVTSAILGLIPNCAASVLIADMWVEGLINYSAMIAGLITSAGIGYLVLFRTNKGIRENLAIISLVLATAIVFGIVLNIFI